MRYTNPKLTEYGSISGRTFTRCEIAEGGSDAPPKDWRTFGLDNFLECSEGHALS